MLSQDEPFKTDANPVEEEVNRQTSTETITITELGAFLTKTKKEAWKIKDERGLTFNMLKKFGTPEIGKTYHISYNILETSHGMNTKWIFSLKKNSNDTSHSQETATQKQINYGLLNVAVELVSIYALLNKPTGTNTIELTNVLVDKTEQFYSLLEKKFKEEPST
jgi:hypothetical protein